MYLVLVFLPLIASIVAGFFGRYLGKRGSVVITVTSVSISTILSCIAFYECALCATTTSVAISNWFSSEMFDAKWGFYFDSLTTVMLIVINLISTLVHIYSISYMWGDPHLPRFMSYLSVFTFFMLMLVTGDNFLQLFFGWEGVGLASYLLINFWFTRLQANKASIKAMLMNRIGDFGLALGIISIFYHFKSVSYACVFSCVAEKADTYFLFFNCQVHALNCIALLLFIGAIGKSAQLGLHTWLPDAMEGPTPVSALIHAATMVTAGVFLICRCSPLFEFAPFALQCVALLGAMTCFFAATTALVQNDLKRVIAYSTCSQLGYMVFACGISNYAVGVFHLVNHAFFKALLFLGAGWVIHALSDEQDMRKMGGSAKFLPLTYSLMLTGTMALVGFPFLTGFYSKDVILECAAAGYSFTADFLYIIGVSCVAFTSYYSFRLLFSTFLVNSNCYKQVSNHALSQSDKLIMAIVLLVLAVASVFIGYMGKDMMIGCATDFWGSALFIAPSHSTLLESEYISQPLKLVPFVFTLLGLLVACLVNYNFVLPKNFFYKLKTTNLSLFPGLSFHGGAIYYFLNKRWYFDLVYNTIARGFMRFAYVVTFKTLDKGSFEMIGPFGISRAFRHLSLQSIQLQSGYIYHYAVVMLCGLTLFITGVVFFDFLELLLDKRLLFLFFTTFSFLHLSP